MNQCTKCGRIIKKSGEHTCSTVPWNKGKKGLQVAWNKGKQTSESTKKKLSETRKRLYSEGKLPDVSGKNNPMFGKVPKTKGVKTGKPSWISGKKMPKEVRDKISGSNHYLWKGGKGSINNRVRKCYQYRQWVQDIFKRDKYTCQECEQIGGRLEAHHIQPFSILIKENKITTVEQAITCYQLWDYDNGLTLCKDCHKKTDSYLKHL